MKVHKRKKSSRYRGTHTHGRGFKKKARGEGHRGGRGMAGIWKHKKSRVINLEIAGLIPREVALRRGTILKKLKVINLFSIEQNLPLFVKKGIAKEAKEKGSYELNLAGYKILGDGDIKLKLIIKASAASQSASEKVKKAGGSIEVEEEIPEMIELKEENKVKVKVRPKAPANK